MLTQTETETEGSYIWHYGGMTPVGARADLMGTARGKTHRLLHAHLIGIVMSKHSKKNKYFVLSMRETLGLLNNYLILP